MPEADIASIAVKIDQKTITETVERIVLQEIASKLGDPGAYFERVVKSCVGTSVDSQGNPCRSDSYNRHGTLIDYLAQKSVTDFAQSIINEWMSDNKDKLRIAIEKSLTKNIGSMAKILADNAAQKTSWSNKLRLEIIPNKN